MKRLGVTLLLILISGCAVNDPVDELLETWRERDRKNEVLSTRNINTRHTPKFSA